MVMTTSFVMTTISKLVVFVCFCERPPSITITRHPEKTRLTHRNLVLIMGFVGYIVKLIHIPVNNILVGGA